MGLDMFLLKKKKYETNKNENQWDEVCYWRKFNALHKWFVDNTQDGIDKCQLSEPISREQIRQLVDLLRSLTPENCALLLPTQIGFFFGNTQYNEYYWEDVKNAIIQLEELLLTFNFERYNLFYQSSW